MKTPIIVSGLLSLVCLIIACKKEELIAYSQGAGISMYKQRMSDGRDSLTRSFAVMAETTTSDTIAIPLRIVGEVSDRDRTVNYGIITDKSDVSKANYELFPAVIPAGSYTGVLQIRVNKTSDLKTRDAKLWITLLASADFIVGPKELSTYLIKINDYLTKPASWDEVRFGEYSQVKYGMIIRETGYHDYTGLKPEVLLYIVSKCRNVLRTYQAEHGTEMMDENKVAVRFP